MSKEPLQRWHGAHHYSDKTHLFLIIFLFFVIFTFLWSYFTLSGLKIKNDDSLDVKPAPSKTITETPAPIPTATPTPDGDKVACTQEAKLCPDGKTWVGRTGPNCEFSKCPNVNR